MKVDQRHFAKVLILVLVGLGILYFGLNYQLGCQAVSTTCTGWNLINPSCLAEMANENLQFTGCTTNEMIIKLAMVLFGLVAVIIAINKY